jgi:hypothetical protein
MLSLYSSDIHMQSIAYRVFHETEPNKWTNSMEQSPFWEASCHSASQEMSHIL